ncbi:Flagellar biosynthetic protein FliP [Durusdinium trenchii]|uniref:Flagellar biosynthetic protein FliP n=1 Tax=Durusdinium trenchii TaxID=1381693 RepID=A0ABP0KK96_9DINO
MIDSEPQPNEMDSVPGPSDSAAQDVEVRPVEFPSAHQTDVNGPRLHLNRLMDVSVTLTVELGRVRMPIGELLQLGRGSVIEFDRNVNEPVDILAQGVRVARGDVVVVDDRYAVRITKIESTDSAQAEALLAGTQQPSAAPPAASQDFVTLDALAGVSLTSPETTPLAPELQALNAITGLGDSGSPTAHVTQASDATSRSAAKEQQKEWAAIGGREDVTWKEGSLLDGWAWNAMGATIVVIGFALATIYVSAGRMKTLAPAHHRQEPASSIKILAEHALPYRSKLLLVSAADELTSHMEDSQAFNALLESEGFNSLAPQVQVALFLGGMVLLSSALVTMTAFTRIVIVLSFVRRALATQEIPPTPVSLGLSIFLTLFVMGPTLEEIESQAVVPYLQEQIDGGEAWSRGSQTLKRFMIAQTRKEELALFVELADVDALETPLDTPMRILVPAFVISELKTAFIMGFCLYSPFLLVDIVISVVLMSLGMMMMPPVVVSAPFKLLLFILVDGWQLVTKALSLSFG